MAGRLQGKTALVTGAARGIGEAVVRHFAQEGARVIATDIRDGQGEGLATALGDAVSYRRLDVREESDWEAVLDWVLADHGALDVLVNNAGITGFEEGAVAHDPEHAALEDWHRVLATNLDGVFLGCKHGIRAMRPAGRGSIVNISSRSGWSGFRARRHTRPARPPFGTTPSRSRCTARSRASPSGATPCIPRLS